MSEPTPPPAPFAPQAPQPFGTAPTEPRVGGCGKPVLIGCGVIFLLIGIAGVALVLNAKSLLAWSLEKAKPSVLAGLAPNVTPADRERFESAFSSALVKIRAGKIDPIALQQVQAQLMKAVGSPGSGSVSRETLNALSEAFEKIGGNSPPAVPEAAPSPAPSETSPPAPPTPATSSPPSAT
ncbi:MAG: hypothetical protein ABI609_10450 [Acidobacteriota bacterium]